MLPVAVTKKNPDAPVKSSKEGGPSLYEEAGREGGRTAQRLVLRVALEAMNWNISRAARLLRMSRPGLSAAVHDLLPNELAEAQAAGRAPRGRPSDSEE